MRVVLVLLLALGLGACTSSGSDRPPRVDVSRLVTADDLPDGFAAQPFEVAPPAAGTSRACRRIAAVAVPSADAPGIRVSYSHVSEGPFVVEQLQAVAEPERLLDELDDAIGSCRTLDLDDGGARTTYQVRRVTVGDAGDEAVGLRLSARLRGTPFASTTTVVRVDDYVAAVSVSGPESQDLHGVRLGDVVRRAVERLSGTSV